MPSTFARADLVIVPGDSDKPVRLVDGGTICIDVFGSHDDTPADIKQAAARRLAVLWNATRGTSIERLEHLTADIGLVDRIDILTERLRRIEAFAEEMAASASPDTATAWLRVASMTNKG